MFRGESPATSGIINNLNEESTSFGNPLPHVGSPQKTTQNFNRGNKPKRNSFIRKADLSIFSSVVHFMSLLFKE